MSSSPIRKNKDQRELYKKKSVSLFDSTLLSYHFCINKALIREVLRLFPPV